MTFLDGLQTMATKINDMRKKQHSTNYEERHKAFADEYLLTCCMKAALDGRFQADISRHTILGDSTFLSRNDVEKFLKENNMSLKTYAGTPYISFGEDEK